MAHPMQRYGAWEPTPSSELKLAWVREIDYRGNSPRWEVVKLVKLLDTNDAERTNINGPWFEIGDIFLPSETRDKFRVAVLDAEIVETP